MLPFVTNYGIELPFVALYDSMWPCMIFFGRACVALLSCIAFLWSCMALEWTCMALEWTCMAFYGRLWQNTDFNGLVSRGHRSIFIWSCFFIIFFSEFKFSCSLNSII